MLPRDVPAVGRPYQIARTIARRCLPLSARIRTYKFLGRLDPRRQRGPLFSAEDIQHVCDTYFRHGPANDTPWDGFRDAHLRLPQWFIHDLDPFGRDYSAQQLRLWQMISAAQAPYDAETHEKEHDLGEVDAVRTPGYYIRRDDLAIQSASDHIIATGMLLKHCGLKAGDWALEYGPSFGQTALALSRLGVNVDTVDISEVFCERIRAQAAFFQVPLSAFSGRFGMNPRPGQRYDLIWFYESFHHCLDFLRLISDLRENLAHGGRVILGGEPIVEYENSAIPYPWGLRLHSEVVAIVRKLSWLELGFTEDFLFRAFAAGGFRGTQIDCNPSLFGRLYEFRLR